MKLKEMQQHMREKGIDSCVFLYKTPNFFYFSQQEFKGAIVVPKSGAVTSIASRLDAPKGKVKFWAGGKFLETVRTVSKGTVGIDQSSMTIRQHRAFKKVFGQPGVDVSKKVIELRKTKTPAEVRLLTKACRITQDILNECMSRFSKFKTELEVAGFLKTKAIENGCETSFEPVVASGGYASIPHHQPKAVKIGKGFCIMDFGVKYKGYCADLTRTVFVGRPTRKDRDLFNTMQQVQQDAIDSIMPGVKSDALYRAAKDWRGRPIMHVLGHAVGIEIHEDPYLVGNRSERLQEGMVLTVEPGSYYPRKFGIRLEDMVLVTKNGCRLLSKQQEFVTA